MLIFIRFFYEQNDEIYGEWRHRMQESFARIRAGLDLLLILREPNESRIVNNNMDTGIAANVDVAVATSMCAGGANEEMRNNVQEVYALHIVGHNEVDLDVLLSVLNPGNVNADMMWNNIGLKLNGRSRSFKSCILLNFAQYKSEYFQLANVCLQQAVQTSSLSPSARAKCNCTIDTTTVTKSFSLLSVDQFPISQQKLTNYQKNYIHSVNSEVQQLQNRVQELEEAVEILHDTALENSELAKKWKLHQSQPRNVKRKATDSGDFVSTKQREDATKEVIETLDIVADTARKKQLVGERVAQHCALSTPTNTSAKCAIADGVIKMLALIRCAEGGCKLNSSLKA